MSKFRGFYEFTDIVNSDEELMLQNLGEKIACAVRHNRIAIQLNTLCLTAHAIFPKILER